MKIGTICCSRRVGPRPLPPVVGAELRRRLRRVLGRRYSWTSRSLTICVHVSQKVRPDRTDRKMVDRNIQNPLPSSCQPYSCHPSPLQADAEATKPARPLACVIGHLSPQKMPLRSLVFSCPLKARLKGIPGPARPIYALPFSRESCYGGSAGFEACEPCRQSRHQGILCQ